MYTCTRALTAEICCVRGPAFTTAPGSSTGIVGRILTGDLPMLPEIYMSCVDVRDVARAARMLQKNKMSLRQ
jgi:hypothetical protein